MSRLTQLHEQITELQIDIDAADARRHKAAAALAQNPRDPDVRAAARQTATHHADLTAEMKLLLDARAAAAAEDASDEAQRRRVAAAQSLKKNESIHRDNVKRAAGIDRALDGLQNAIAAWLEGAAAHEDAQREFIGLALSRGARRPDHFFNGDATAYLTNAIAGRIDTALRGLNMGRNMILSYVGTSNTCADEAKRFAERRCIHMRQIAKEEGLPE